MVCFLYPDDIVKEFV